MKVIKILKATVVLFLMGSVQIANAEEAKYISYGSTQPKNAVLEKLSKSAHSITDTTVFRCKSKIDNKINEKDKATLNLACEVQGLKALSAFSICAVYDNTQSLSDSRTEACFNSILNRY